MDKIIKGIILFLLFTSQIFGQVPWTSKQVSTGFLMDIKFKTNTIGCVVGGGNNQAIYTTSNGGVNWFLTNTSSSLTSVIVDLSGNFFAAGSSLLKSTNNGMNWTTVVSGPPYNDIIKIQFTSADTAYFLNMNGNVFKSTDSGVNWSLNSTGAVSPVDMCFINSLTGYITQSNGQPLKTTNGGINWGLFSTGITSCRIVEFINSNTGYIGTWTEIHRTTNGGQNWSMITLPGASSIREILFRNASTGYACGQPNVYKTTNSGINWFTLPMGTSQDFSSVNFPSNDTGYISAISGWVFKTITGGVSRVINISEPIPQNYSLKQNYPNPFNPVTKIRFDIPHWREEGGRTVTLKAYDVMGSEVQALVNEKLQPGRYEVTFDGSTLNSGVYFYKITAGDFTETKKLILIK